MPVIYVPQEQRGKNLAPALRYGTKIVSCLPQDYQIYATPNDLVDPMRKVLGEMQSDDFLLLIGDPILIGVAATIAFEIHETVNFLKWDRQTRTYVPVDVCIT